MKLGPLAIGWSPLSEGDRIKLGLDPCRQGWEMLSIEWRDQGIGLLCRPRRA